MKKKNIKIIIALGHSGYEIDKELARNVPELDLVVGGHSHSFLYTINGTGSLPSTEVPSGDYPTYIKNKKTGKVIPVVQAYCYTKYLGHLKIQFDHQGEIVKPVDGVGVTYANPILLDKAVEEDLDTLDKVNHWKKDLQEYKVTVGENKVSLVRNFSGESNLGNVVCQSIAAVYDNTEIAFSNNGGIRTNLPIGDITFEDLVITYPFNNTVDHVTMKGENIRQFMEYRASRINPDDVTEYPGFGYQFSGLRVKIKPSNQKKKVFDIQVLDNKGTYARLLDETVYNVALPSFVVGKAMIKNKFLAFKKGTITVQEALRNYYKQYSPIVQEVDGRLKIY